jgi:hypothetical protein
MRQRAARDPPKSSRMRSSEPSTFTVSHDDEGSNAAKEGRNLHLRLNDNLTDCSLGVGPSRCPRLHLGAQLLLKRFNTL